MLASHGDSLPSSSYGQSSQLGAEPSAARRTAEAIQSFVGANGQPGDDGLYGSRHLARKLKANGTAGRVRGFFPLDMIGDRNLGVARETKSTRWLQDFIGQAAKELGYERYFFRYETEIIDDHVSFLDVGIPAVATATPGLTTRAECCS